MRRTHHPTRWIRVIGLVDGCAALLPTTWDPDQLLPFALDWLSGSPPSRLWKCNPFAVDLALEFDEAVRIAVSKNQTEGGEGQAQAKRKRTFEQVPAVPGMVASAGRSRQLPSSTAGARNQPIGALQTPALPPRLCRSSAATLSAIVQRPARAGRSHHRLATVELVRKGPRKGLLAAFALAFFSCAVAEFNTGKLLSGSNGSPWLGFSFFMHCAKMHF